MSEEHMHGSSSIGTVTLPSRRKTRENHPQRVMLQSQLQQVEDTRDELRERETDHGVAKEPCGHVHVPGNAFRVHRYT